jgi:hypothetical protein
VVLDDAVAPAVDVVAAEELEDDVLGRDPRRKLARELDAPDLGHPDEEGLSHHGQRHLDAAGAEGEHADRPGRARVGVGTGHGLAGDTEARHVHGVRDAVAGLGEPYAEAPARAVQEEVVVGVALVGLEEVVVDVLGGELGVHAVETHRLELEHHEGAGSVLG